MSLTTSQWDKRYQQQAHWTQDIRKYIYKKIGIQQFHRILDVGCGTGVLENELSQLVSSFTFGLDVDPVALAFAQISALSSYFTLGNGLYLPFPNEVFDVTLCHYLLLWINEPQKVVKEMARVTRNGGYVLALAEPDYGGRIDFPNELSWLGIWQIDALKAQGANPFMGREVRSLFSQAGLVDIEVGVLGGQWNEGVSDQEIELEWELLRSDLNQNNEFIKQSDKLIEIDLSSRDTYQRILFVPTFYAIGKLIK